MPTWTRGGRMRQGSLLTDQLVSDALQQLEGTLPPTTPPPPTLLVRYCTTTSQARKSSEWAHLFSGLRGLSTDAGAQGPTTTDRDAKPVSCR